METNVEGDLQSVALVCAAVESRGTGQPIPVQAFLEQVRAQAVAEGW